MSWAAAIMRSVDVKKSIKYSFLHNISLSLSFYDDEIPRNLCEHKTPSIELLSISVCIKKKNQSKKKGGGERRRRRKRWKSLV